MGKVVEPQALEGSATEVDNPCVVLKLHGSWPAAGEPLHADLGVLPRPDSRRGPPYWLNSHRHVEDVLLAKGKLPPKTPQRRRARAIESFVRTGDACRSCRAGGPGTASPVGTIWFVRRTASISISARFAGSACDVSAQIDRACVTVPRRSAPAPHTSGNRQRIRPLRAPDGGCGPIPTAGLRPRAAALQETGVVWSLAAFLLVHDWLSPAGSPSPGSGRCRIKQTVDLRAQPQARICAKDHHPQPARTHHRNTKGMMDTGNCRRASDLGGRPWPQSGKQVVATKGGVM